MNSRLSHILRYKRFSYQIGKTIIANINNKLGMKKKKKEKRFVNAEFYLAFVIFDVVY